MNLTEYVLKLALGSQDLSWLKDPISGLGITKNDSKNVPRRIVNHSIWFGKSYLSDLGLIRGYFNKFLERN